MRHITKKWLAAGSLLAVAITFCAWRAADKGFQDRQGFSAGDTTPARKYRSNDNFRSRDLDHAIQDVDRAMLELDVDIDAQVKKELKRAMAEIKKIDFDKIGKDISVSLSKVNWDATQREVALAMEQASREIKNIDMKEVANNIDKAMSKLDMQELMNNIDVDIIGNSVAAGLSAAKLGLEKARTELARYKDFVHDLEKDGLIDRKKGYSIKVKDGELFINGTRQPREIQDKYSDFLKGKDFSISDDAGEPTKI